MQLSPHFSLAELTHSEIAVRRGLDNTPNADSLENLKMLAGYLERVRDILQVPIVIHSGYRSLKVNIAVGGSPNSSHMRGEAADFTAPQYGTPQEIAKKILVSGIMFDQLIYEGAWVHFGIDGMMRRQVLTAHFAGGKATYSSGIA
jgi:zinc D-Ala-D-Ala carboxypeptidase